MGFIPKHGGYRGLLSYQKAEIVYDMTVIFCRRFLEKRDRTVDQMIQAARSGKQSIAEGSQASGTSTETEIKLISVARASLEELLIDFQDYLRVKGMTMWSKNSAEVRFVRDMGRRNESAEAFARSPNRAPGTWSPTSPSASSTRPTFCSIAS
jgi:four helix bundle protein